MPQMLRRDMYAEWYHLGYSMSEIAGFYGVTKAAVAQGLKDSGTPIRPRGPSAYFHRCIVCDKYLTTGKVIISSDGNTFCAVHWKPER